MTRGAVRSVVEYKRAGVGELLSRRILIEEQDSFGVWRTQVETPWVDADFLDYREFHRLHRIIEEKPEGVESG